MLGKKEIVYIDRLADYRKIQYGGFHLFDKVIVENTIYSYQRKHIGTKGVLVYIDSDSDSDSDPRVSYRIVTPDGKLLLIEGTLKKDYGEFQEEFEALAETEKLALEVQERLQRLEQLKKKTDKIKDFNFKNLGL